MAIAQTPTISAADLRCLQDLARRVAEIAALPEQQEKADMWRRHNQLERVRPIVLVFPEGSWRELLPGDSLTTTSQLARGFEADLRRRIYYHDHLQDDNVTEAVMPSPIVVHNTGWGVAMHNTAPEEQFGAYHIDPVILSEDDIGKLRTPEVSVDHDATERRYQQTCEIFGGILEIEKRGTFRGGICPLDMYSRLRGIDNMFLDLIDNPNMVHTIVSKLVDGHIAMLKSLEEQGALTLGNRNHYAGSGGTSYTDELPQPDFDGTHVRLRDLWGFATDQIFSEVSPAMHEEFALRHEERYLDLFGLNCYGCCEPLHHKLDALFKYVPRLRRVSISPWADIRISSETLQDRCIFSWKPNPAVLAGESWEPEHVRREIREFCDTTRGNIAEIIMKDTHTVRHAPERMWEWVRVAREVAADYA